ncbi:hypothetical protein LV716_10920 [Flagellimonas sp. HMM57]|uniref:hypothetical protein n=1 Tax=unclassified Flagellimonas TaxID=2644544 RepID=UPI001F0B49BA|nr:MULTISPECIES: hypothetical protein [unclassified Flagellimonas]UII74776.1 hypothetical protein LV716_10920 [Flagellimonas sp. HMM57]
MKTNNSKIRTISIIATLFLGLLIGVKGYAQKTKKSVLANMWHLYAYKVGEKEYAPKKREKDDFILFEEDMSFVSTTEGKREEGTYFLNSNGGYLEFVDNKGDRLKAFIISIDKETLILKFDIKEMREVEVHYKSHIIVPNQ